MTLLAVSQGGAGELVVDYVSRDGAEVTMWRGSLLASSLQSLKEASLFDAYCARLPAARRDELLYALVSSWLPVELAHIHNAACDGLKLSDRELYKHGEMICNQLSGTLYAAIFRASRRIGVIDPWQLLLPSDRLFQRLYIGGSWSVLKLGPKDVVLEVRGLPMLTSRFYRACHHAYLKALAALTGKGVHMNPVRPRDPHPHSAATALSWV
jgi:hypothetical protein